MVCDECDWLVLWLWVLLIIFIVVGLVVLVGGGLFVLFSFWIEGVLMVVSGDWDDYDYCCGGFEELVFGVEVEIEKLFM